MIALLHYLNNFLQKSNQSDIILLHIEPETFSCDHQNVIYVFAKPLTSFYTENAGETQRAICKQQLLLSIEISFNQLNIERTHAIHTVCRYHKT